MEMANRWAGYETISRRAVHELLFYFFFLYSLRLFAAGGGYTALRGVGALPLTDVTGSVEN